MVYSISSYLSILIALCGDKNILVVLLPRVRMRSKGLSNRSWCLSVCDQIFFRNRRLKHTILYTNDRSCRCIAPIASCISVAVNSSTKTATLLFYYSIFNFGPHPPIIIKLHPLLPHHISLKILQKTQGSGQVKVSMICM